MKNECLKCKKNILGQGYCSKECVDEAFAEEYNDKYVILWLQINNFLDFCFEKLKIEPNIGDYEIDKYIEMIKRS